MRLLTSENRHSQPEKPVRKRRRRDDPSSQNRNLREFTPETSDHEAIDHNNKANTESNNTTPTAPLDPSIEEESDEQIRLTNAYPGATNSINSIHQRKWFLSMDRSASGFSPVADGDGGRRWVRRHEADNDGRLSGFEPFFVRGREYERSVVTGRTAGEVMGDEGVEGFVGRKGWRAVVE